MVPKRMKIFHVVSMEDFFLLIYLHSTFKVSFYCLSGQTSDAILNCYGIIHVSADAL